MAKINVNADKNKDTDQLGEKDENLDGDTLIREGMLAWTPGQEQRLTANVFQQDGITKTQYPRPKQISPVSYEPYRGS